jgi:hypothetical protein
VSTTVPNARPLDPAAIAQLRTQVDGPIHAPGDPSYDEARLPWNRALTQHPAVVIEPVSTADVVQAMAFARTTGLPVAVASTGHGFASAADGAVLVLTRQLDHVDIDPGTRRARLGGGVQWGPVLETAQAHGLAPLLGSAPHVGAVGYTLGGGHGWLARQHGLSADRVVSFELVTPDGTVHHTTRSDEPDLFHALRGGGAGSLGIVTAMEIELVEVTTVVGGNLLYPIENAAEVMTRFRDWAHDLPGAMTAAVTLMNFPPLPEVPEPVRGRSFAIVRGCHCGDPADANELLDHWRSWRAPVLDMFGPMPFTEVATISQDPVDPMPAAVTSAVLHDLDDGAIRAIMDHTVPTDGPPLVIFTEARRLGGVVGRGDSPVGERLRNAGYLVESVGIIPEPDLTPVVEGLMANLRKGLADSSTGAAYLNFLDGEDKRVAGPAVLPPGAWARAQRMKAVVDPGNVMAHGLDLTG